MRKALKRKFILAVFISIGLGVWLIWLGGVCGGSGDEAEASRVF